MQELPPGWDGVPGCGWGALVFSAWGGHRECWGACGEAGRQSLSRSDAGVSGALILCLCVPSSRAVRGEGAPKAAGSAAV